LRLPDLFRFPSHYFGKVQTDRILHFLGGEIVFAVKVDVFPGDNRTGFDCDGQEKQETKLSLLL